jgi:L-lactate dehydrogenase
MSKITIIGAGSVGSTIAYTLVTKGIASEVVMLDINTKKALGEAMDIRQGTPFCAPVTIYAGSYEDAKDSDIVIITSGIARKPGQSRLDLAQTNVNVMKSIIPEITRYAPNAVYIVVSNPVDVLTYVFNKISGLPENKIIGSGTILDTSRLRSRLAEYFSISQSNIHAYVFGEHGDTSFVPWSIATLPSIGINDYKEGVIRNKSIRRELNREEVENYIRTSGGKIIERKGATFYAVAISVCHICKCIFSSVDTALTVSTMMHGEYDIEDVCLSTINMVGSSGITGKIHSPLTNEEIVLLNKSADSLKNIIKNLDI